MPRMLVVIATTLAAAAIAAVPAVLGLVGNPTFSQQLPVRAPANAAHVSDVAGPGSGGARPTEPADDRGGSSVGATASRSAALGSAEPAARRSESAEPAEHRGRSTETDDHGGGSGGGSGGGEGGSNGGGGASSRASSTSGHGGGSDG